MAKAKGMNANELFSAATRIKSLMDSANAIGNSAGAAVLSTKFTDLSNQ